jgi:hypothetical protein
MQRGEVFVKKTVFNCVLSGLIPRRKQVRTLRQLFVNSCGC